MRADYPVILDACVLAPASLSDILLSLAEAPRLYLPQWTEEIMSEVQRTQTVALEWPENLVRYWQSEVRKHFPEALVENYESLKGVCENDEKDKHVLAAAIKCRSELIVTSNLKHFPKGALDKWGVSAIHPSQFLTDLYIIDGGVVVSKIEAIARRRKKPPEAVLGSLRRSVPEFCEFVALALGWEIP